MNWLTERQLSNFWKKVVKRTKDECWEWIGGVDNKNKKAPYGRQTINGKKLYAHRISYFINIGDFDESLEVMHTCDNSLCVNPHHLKLGTHHDNMMDMVEKKRYCKGTNLASSKLNEQKVKEIRELYKKGESCRKIAPKYNVSKTTIADVVNNRYWTHVT